MRSRRSTAVALVFLATFADLLAYSIAVPVLPDLSARLGASPTIIGFLFSSFGLTMLMVSIPMGAVSDRTGRKVPMVLGLAVLAVSSVLLAVADSLAWLFAARLAEYGINVYEIRPGIIATDMTGTVKEKYDRLIADGLTPIQRWGTPEDAGKAVAAIAQDLLPFSTGEVINVDGGFHLRRL